jgi:hypothetical protein
MKHVTFPQAQWLREKGFDEECKEVFSLDMVGDTIPHTYPSEHYNGKHQHIWLRPEQWQVVEWLRVNHGIWIHVHLETKVKGLEISSTNKYQASINRVNHTSIFGKISKDDIPDGPYRKPQDTPYIAYSAAFDYIKDKGLI